MQDWQDLVHNCMTINVFVPVLGTVPVKLLLGWRFHILTGHRWGEGLLSWKRLHLAIRCQSMPKNKKASNETLGRQKICEGTALSGGFDGIECEWEFWNLWVISMLFSCWRRSKQISSKALPLHGRYGLSSSKIVYFFYYNSKPKNQTGFPEFPTGFSCQTFFCGSAGCVVSQSPVARDQSGCQSEVWFWPWIRDAMSSSDPVPKISAHCASEPFEWSNPLLSLAIYRGKSWNSCPTWFFQTWHDTQHSKTPLWLPALLERRAGSMSWKRALPPNIVGWPLQWLEVLLRDAQARTLFSDLSQHPTRSCYELPSCCSES